MFAYYYGIDITYIVLVLSAILLGLWAQMRVKSTYARYSHVRSARGITAEEAARLILDMNGLSQVPIQRVRGSLTDHYDPRQRVVRLSDSVYGSTSVAAIGVAAVLSGQVKVRPDEKVCFVLTGGNIDAEKLAQFITA